jgi:hypothetical protein
LDKFPAEFELKAKANGKGTIAPVKTERMLLNQFLGLIPCSFVFELSLTAI